MNYVLIFTRDNGAQWQATGIAFNDSEDALRALRESMAANPDLRYEMHPLHPNLYSALTQDTPVDEPFF